MNAPWLKFYPSDWRSDPRLRLCSLEARGLWIELLCLMHEAEPYGHATTNGGRLTDRQIGSLAGVSPKDATRLLTELEEAGVFSRNTDGVIFSRRMVRDGEKAAADKANGRRGGNPRLTPGVNPPDKPEGCGGDKPEDKAQKPEARSQIDASASSASEPAAKAGRSKPKRSLPEGFPDDAAVSDGQARLRAAGVNVDARLQAERFRNHAEQTDRRASDWKAAWRNWIIGAIEKAGGNALAPSLPLAAAPAWNGPPELLSQLERQHPGLWPSVAGYIPRCRWRDVPSRALVAPSEFVRSRIGRDFGAPLERLGIDLIVEQAA